MRVASFKCGMPDEQSSTLPPLLNDLLRTFQALNTVYSFLSTRKHLVPTVSSLRRSVEALTHSPLTVTDLARIKALCPDLVTFGHVDTEPQHKRRRDVYDPPEHTADLIFEFADRPVEGPRATGRGQVRGKDQSKSVVETINRRTDVFCRALTEFVAAASAAGEDPVELLAAAAEEFVPNTGTKRDELPEERPSVKELLDSMANEPWWRDQIVPGGRKTIKAREAAYAMPKRPLPEAVLQALASYGVERLYTHQAAALDALEDGNVIVATGTSSGKSLVYQLAIARALEEPCATAMCLFPTKALAQDQLQSMQRLFSAVGTPLAEAYIATFDGDTPFDMRNAIRKSVRVCFTNPDMLHETILPSEDHWRHFFGNLRVCVIDELHIYSGSFGAHVGMVIRRLRRICAALGNDDVRFVSCSATIANPKRHMESVTGAGNVCVVDCDGAPRGAQEWVLWNPPLIDPKSSSGRVSTFAEVSRVFRHLVLRKVRTIVFSKVRRTAEIAVRQIREDLAQDGKNDVAARVVAYRGGYSVQDRRKIEADMFCGEIAGIVATSALELGVDIGALDAVIMLGIPYSLASMWQQAGRAGRRQRDSLVMVVAEPFSVDQFYMRHPELLFGQHIPPPLLDMENELVLEAHVRCAAHEVPVDLSTDEHFFGTRIHALSQALLERDSRGFYHLTDGDAAPARHVQIRGARVDPYVYVDVTGPPAVMEEVEAERSIFEAFEGAVFLHQGTPYICTQVSHDTRVVRMVKTDVRYHTRPRDHTDIDAIETLRIRTLEHADVYAYFGRIRITSHVWGYFKVDRRGMVLDAVEVNTPPMVRYTHGVWLDVPWHIVETIADHGINVPGAIHAAAHAILSLSPLFVASVSQDVQTECKVQKREYSSRPTQRKRPSRIIFFDRPGVASGVSERVFYHMDALLRISLATIEDCACSDGCPGCVAGMSCVEENLVSSKHGARAVLCGLLGREMFPDDKCKLATNREPFLHTLCDAEEIPTADGSVVEIEHVREDDPPSNTHNPLALSRPRPRLVSDSTKYVE